MVIGKEIRLQTKGFSEIHDITQEVAKIIEASGLSDGIACISVVGSTASITTIEFEPALSADFRDKLNEIAPEDKPTRHGDTWGDDNGFSHLRASLMGPGVSLPFSEGRLILGTWQQIVVVDHDNRPRDRRIHVQLVGE